MSNFPTAPTSTTDSSSSSASEATALIACGALAQAAVQIADRRGWSLEVFPLPPLLHNQPHLITGQVERLLDRLQPRYQRVAIGYADCGTYGALDDLCRRRGVARLPGLHCYDVYGGADRVADFFADQPGTYLFTDFLVRSFERTVLRELGLDRHPELLADYFGSYTRVVWLTQAPDDDLRERAAAAADTLGLPLRIVETGDAGLETALAALVERAR